MQLIVRLGRAGAAGILPAAGLALALAAGPADAQSVRQIGSFRDWSAYSAAEGTGHICFAMAKAAEVTPQPDGYTQAYLYLTRRPAENVSNELNLVAGFALDPDQPATLSVAGQTFNLFARDDAAWLQDTSQNDSLAGDMRAGTTAVIDVTSDKGIKVEETFSLAGATAASRAIGTC
ncbi:MAG TPA: invasion associated locus B family protein [Devosia sp.]|nr:invasion associated locus B family protein [Devosia sp.]